MSLHAVYTVGFFLRYQNTGTLDNIIMYIIMLLQIYMTTVQVLKDRCRRVIVLEIVITR